MCVSGGRIDRTEANGKKIWQSDPMTNFSLSIQPHTPLAQSSGREEQSVGATVD